VARGFSLTFAMGDEGQPALPGNGWDGIIRWSSLDRLTERTPTHASAVEIAIAPEARREWAGLVFDSDGPVEVPGALVPVHVDLAQNHAVYVEPNVWMEHRW